MAYAADVSRLTKGLQELLPSRVALPSSPFGRRDSRGRAAVRPAAAGACLQAPGNCKEAWGMMLCYTPSPVGPCGPEGSRTTAQMGHVNRARKELLADSGLSFVCAWLAGLRRAPPRACMCPA